MHKKRGVYTTQFQPAVTPSAARTAGERSRPPSAPLPSEVPPTQPSSPFAVAPPARPRRCRPPGACTAGKRC
eukprot:scaffold69818_cov67-Phaeocystis_antarctica.AAC.1